jgi:integrase
MHELTPVVLTNSQSETLDLFAGRVANIISEAVGITRRPALSGLTLRQLFDRYLRDYAKPHCRSWRDMERAFKNYFERFAEQDLYKIQRVDVQAWHSEIGEVNGHHAANRALELMVMLYNKAQEWDLIALVNPGVKIKKFKLYSRERFLQPDELPRFFAALSTLRYPVTRDLFLMCLFTGARVGNVRAMKWAEIDPDLRTWRIPRTKNNTSQIVPLTTEALSVLDSCRKGNNSEWVFLNNSGTDHIKYVDLAWRNLIKKAGIENLRIHDLRRSMASWQAITGASTTVIAATLNHKNLASTEVYARLNTSAVRLAMKTATQTMLEKAGIFVESEPTELNDLPAISVSLFPQAKADEPWLSTVEIILVTGVTMGKLQYWKAHNTGPAYLKQGINVMYRESAVRQWVTARGLAELNEEWIDVE